LLYWFGSTPWRWCPPFAVFCAILCSVSSMARWFPRNYMKNSFAMGGGGASRSLLPSCPLPDPWAPEQVRVIYRISTSNYWMTSRNHRGIVYLCQTEFTRENLNSYNKTEAQ
jgi:hypothetical protein